jgi:hypothetical protein
MRQKGGLLGPPFLFRSCRSPPSHRFSARTILWSGAMPSLVRSEYSGFHKPTHRSRSPGTDPTERAIQPTHQAQVACRTRPRHLPSQPHPQRHRCPASQGPRHGCLSPNHRDVDRKAGQRPGIPRTARPCACLDVGSPTASVKCRARSSGTLSSVSMQQKERMT